MTMAKSAGSSHNARIVIVADSRGKGLQSELDQLNTDGHVTIKVIVKKGRGIADLIRDTSKELIWMAPTQIYVLAGICDVTHLNRQTMTVSLEEESTEILVGKTEGSMDAARHHLSIVLTEAPYKLMFCPTVGMDMAKYNGLPNRHAQQDHLDEMIISMNHAIIAFNKANHVLTPWTNKEIRHNKKGGRKDTRYYKLADDGLHLSEETKKKWALTLYNAILKNLNA